MIAMSLLMVLLEMDSHEYCKRATECAASVWKAVTPIEIVWWRREIDKSDRARPLTGRESFVYFPPSQARLKRRIFISPQLL